MNDITIRTSATPNMKYVFHYKDGDIITLIYEDKAALTAPAATVLLQGLARDKSGVMVLRDKNEAYFIPTTGLLYVKVNTFTPTQEQLDFYNFEDKFSRGEDDWYEAEKKVFEDPEELKAIQQQLADIISGKDSDESETATP